MAINGARVVSDCASGSITTSTARSFYGLFYQWNRSSCSRKYTCFRQFGNRNRPRKAALRYSSNLSKATYSSQTAAPNTPHAIQSSTNASVSPPANKSEDAPHHAKPPRFTTPFESAELPPIQVRKITTRKAMNQATENPDTLRHLMRKVPHSVVVVTSGPPTEWKQHKTADGTTARFHGYKGMTLSSFTTLTLTPFPIVTFNIRRPSKTLKTLAKSRHFLVHLLEGDTWGAMLADTFAQGNSGTPGSKAGNSPFQDFDVEDLLVHKDDGVGELQRVYLPRIRDPGVKAVMLCELLESNGNGLNRVGDHDVIFASVTKVMTVKEGAEAEGYGLTYVDGGYRVAGEVVEKMEREEYKGILKSEGEKRAEVARAVAAKRVEMEKRQAREALERYERNSKGAAPSVLSGTVTEADHHVDGAVTPVSKASVS